MNQILWACAGLVGLCAGCSTIDEAPRGLAGGPGSPIAVGPQPGSPAVGDFNGDGRLDIVLTCGTREAPKVGGVLLLLHQGGGGGGAFSAVPAGRIALSQPVDSLAVADFNGDRVPDVVAVGHDSYLVHMLLGDGKGGLVSSRSYPAHTGTRPHTHAIATGDVNKDGHADVLTTNSDDDAISVLLGDGRGGLAPAPGSPFAAPRHPYSNLVVQDLNDDGMTDVAVPLLGSGEIGVYLGNGTGGFSPAPGAPYRVDARPGFVHADDINGDGRPDLMATHDDVGIVDVLLNEGGGRFRAAPGSPVQLKEQVWSIITGDFHGDRHRDALLTAYPGRRLVLLRGDGRGGFTQVRGPDTGESPNRLAAADLDGDGRTDVVTTNHDSGDVTVLFQR